MSLKISISLRCQNWILWSWNEVLGYRIRASQVVLVVKNLSTSAGDVKDTCLIPGSGRSPGGHGNPLHYSCLENPMDRGTGKAIVHRVAESQTRLWSDLDQIIKMFSSVAQSCRTLCDPMNHSTPGLLVHHHLPEFTQTHIHRVSDGIHPSHPLSSPLPPTHNPSQHQSLFQGVNSSHEVAKVQEFQL